MSVQTVLLDFSIDPGRITDECSRKDLLKLVTGCLEQDFPDIKIVHDILTADGYLCTLSDRNLIFFTIRCFNHGIITVNIEYYKAEHEPQRLSFDVSIFFYVGMCFSNLYIFSD